MIKIENGRLILSKDGLRKIFDITTDKSLCALITPLETYLEKELSADEKTKITNALLKKKELLQAQKVVIESEIAKITV